MRDLLTEELLRKADEVAALLNQVEDDDEREQVQGLYEQRLNIGLFDGSQVRAALRVDAAREGLARGLRLATPLPWGTSL